VTATRRGHRLGRPFASRTFFFFRLTDLPLYGRKFDKLPIEPNHPARRFISLEDCLLRYRAIRSFICEVKKDHIGCDLEIARDVINDSACTLVDEMRTAINDVNTKGKKTFDDHMESGVHPRTAWFAAYMFHLRGEDITCSPSWHNVGWSCVMRPAVFEFMQQYFKFDIACIAGLTEVEAKDLRADIESDLNVCRGTLAFCPSIAVLEALETALKDTTFFTDRVLRFLSDGVYDRFADLLVA